MGQIHTLGLITGAMLDLRNSFPALDRSETLRRWLVSTAPIGAIIGAALAVFLNDFYGRKESLKASNFFYLFGTIIIIVSQHHILLFLGRFIEGVGIGLITVTCPLYIAEGSHPRDRSRLVIVFVLMILIGRFFAGMATSILKEVRIIVILLGAICTFKIVLLFSMVAISSNISLIQTSCLAGFLKF